ncbi:MAG: arylsulfatase [Pirellulaceae bacterium]|jgi:uncharacterized sulfatase|nr:arylsulfatase [Pirellulaceae bacterium]MDP7014297.1 arylsulfatase [Pirellulaceae bacterium]
MSRSGYIWCVAAAAVVLAEPVSAQTAAQPNIIFIMADDLGYGDLGCFGQERIQTPQLDRLAKEGTRLTSFYAGCTVCRPSRLVLWTGRHTGHTAINSNASYVFKEADTTVAERLQKVGYRTGGVGKWAMGGPLTTGRPTRNGFDFWMGYLDQGAAHNYYPTHLFRNGKRVELAGNVLSDHPRARGRVSSQRRTYSHDVMTDEALEFIRRNRANPFLLHVHWTIPHANNEGGRVTGDGMETPNYGVYESRKWPATARGHAAMITRMDADVGRIVGLLKELKIERRTLVFFTSDNGPHSEGGHRHEFFNSNGPLRGFKRDLYEGGIRVPTIAWWPGVTPAGATCDEPLAFWDFVPTACDLAGADPPAETDGISFVSTLRGQVQTSHEFLYWRYGKKTAIRAGKWKAVRIKDDGAWRLFDLSEDIGETDDVADAHPQIAKEMQRRHEASSP